MRCVIILFNSFKSSLLMLSRDATKNFRKLRCRVNGLTFIIRVLAFWFHIFLPSTRQDSGYAIAPWPRGETRIIIFILIFATSLLVLREDNIWWGGGILGLICWAALIIGSAGVPRLQPCHIFLFSAMTENKDIKNYADEAALCSFGCHQYFEGDYQKQIGG